MFTLMRMLSTQRLVLEQLPALGAAWIVAELFYEFGSFSLECGALLATWFAFDAALQLVKQRLEARYEDRRRAGATASAG